MLRVAVGWRPRVVARSPALLALQLVLGPPQLLPQPADLRSPQRAAAAEGTGRAARQPLRLRTSSGVPLPLSTLLRRSFAASAALSRSCAALSFSFEDLSFFESTLIRSSRSSSSARSSCAVRLSASTWRQSTSLR